MNILWILDHGTPDVALKLGMSIKNTGGWKNILSKQLSKDNTLGMTILTNSRGGYKSGTIDGIRYYLTPIRTGRLFDEKKTKRVFLQVFEEFKPDVIHIWGTEKNFCYGVMKAAEEVGLLERTVISIQGILSFIVKHYWAYIYDARIRIPTMWTLIKGGGFKGQYGSFERNAKYEIKMLSMAKSVIGRTTWDRSCVKLLNKDIRYFKCNETLREVFYTRKWSIQDCERRTVFLSQGSYPVKGLHIALEALSILKEKYPDVRLYTTGSVPEIMFKQTRYDIFIRRFIKKYDLSDNIAFLGFLTEEEMCMRYLRSNVSICSSSIENSSNSIAEAMMLGMPIVASYVGGINSFIEHEKEGFLYQPDAPYMLAHYVEDIFDDDERAIRLGERARYKALELYDKEKNYSQLMEIYEVVSEKNHG